MFSLHNIQHNDKSNIGKKWSFNDLKSVLEFYKKILDGVSLDIMYRQRILEPIYWAKWNWEKEATLGFEIFLVCFEKIAETIWSEDDTFIFHSTKEIIPKIANVDELMRFAVKMTDIPTRIIKSPI